MFAEACAPVEATLFETRSETLVPDESALPEIVLEHLSEAMPRDGLISSVMRSHLGVYGETAIRRSVTELIKQKKVISATGKARINGKVRIWRADSH